MSEESSKIERYYDSDFVKFVFTIEDGYLSNISIEIKEGAPYPKINLDGTGRSNIWFGMLRENIEQGLFVAPSTEKSRPGVPGKQIIDQEALVTDETNTGGKASGILICPRCDMELVEEEQCCGKRAKVAICPKCGGRFRKPLRFDVPNEGGHKGFEGLGGLPDNKFRKKDGVTND